MGFYNISYIIKSIFYNIRKSLKYIVFIMLFLTIIIFIVLDATASPVKAAGVFNDEMYDACIDKYHSSNYTDFIVSNIYYNSNNTSGIYLILFSNPTGNKIYLERANAYWLNGLWLNSQTSDISCEVYQVSSNGNLTFIADNLSFGVGQYKIFIGNYALTDQFIFASTVNVYSDNNFNNIYFTASDERFIKPSVLNSSINLTNNTFDNFIIDLGSYETLNFAIMNITDTVAYLDNPTITIKLSSDSKYRTIGTDNKVYYVIPKTDLNSSIFKQINGQRYRLLLYTTSIDLADYNSTFTFDMTAQTVEDTEQETQQNINNGVQDINNFLNNDNTDPSEITNNMPSSSNIENPTESGFNNIFTAFRNAFINDNPPDFEFIIPFTNNEKIIIPSNFISSRLPSVVILLIQGFYWFIICRYIVKDISATVENAKSGHILDTKDGNIKTDLL